jgi:3-dehydrosphinganine reductase
MTGHAIITGGGSGIGFEFARQFALAGKAVTLISRSQERLASAEQRLRKEFPSVPVSVFPADVGNEEALVKAVQGATARHGSPDWVIANAGMVEPGIFLEQPSGDGVAQMRTNYFGSLFLAKATAPLMKEKGGHLVFIGSGAAFSGIYGYSTYGASKFAVRGLAESLRVELAGEGIVVTLVQPGDTATPQLVHDISRRPAATKLIAGSDVTSASEVARIAIAEARRGSFVVTFGARLKLLAWIHSLIGGVFRRHQKRVVRRLAARS